MTFRGTALGVIPPVGRGSHAADDLSHRRVCVEYMRDDLVEPEGEVGPSVPSQRQEAARSDLNHSRSNCQQDLRCWFFLDGCLSRGGDEGPGHKPMVRRVPWNTDDINHRRRIVHPSNDDVKDATAILSRTSDALNGSKHVHQLSVTGSSGRSKRMLRSPVMT